MLQVANYQINSAVHKAKLRIWQALAVLSAFIPHEEVQEAIAQLWPILQVSLHAKQHGTCQQQVIHRCKLLLLATLCLLHTSTHSAPVCQL